MAGTNLWMISTEESEHRLHTPKLPEGIREDDIQSVGCGEECLSIITKDGKVHTNKIQNNELSPEWKQPSNLTNHVVCQVQSGLSHCVALTKNHKVVTWGKNDHGQLGLGQQAASSKHAKGTKPKNIFFNARLIPSLQNIKVLDISCGNNHSMCLSEEGCIYTWGANEYGQLGQTASSVEVPKIVQQLGNTHIVKISAGGNHNFAMSVSGNVFCWGSNSFGQLGIASEENSCPYPVVCSQLCGQKIDSICCGANHTAVLMEDGCILTCGQAGAGQLGHENLRKESQLKQVSALLNTPVTQIACGRNHTVAWIRSTDQIHILGNDRKVTIDFPNQQMNSTLLCGGQCSFVYQSSTNRDEEASAGSECQLLTLDFVQDVMKHSRDNSKINILLEKTLSYASCINGSFLKKCVCLETDHGIDIERAETFFKELRKTPYHNIAQKSLKKLLRGQTDSPLFGVETLRLYLLLPCCLYADNVMYDEDVVASLARLLVCLDDGKKKILGKWLKNIPIKFFKRFVWFFKMCLVKVLNRLRNIQNEISKEKTIVKDCVEMLDMLNQVNLLRSLSISYEKFHVNELMEKINIEGDFQSMMQDKRSDQDFEFRYCNYPFLYNSASKFTLLKCQCEEEMKMVDIPFFFQPELKVRRNHLVEDTRACISRNRSILRQKLNVIFQDELSYSGNGIRQEFFEVLFEKLLNPEFGVFYYEDGSKSQWLKKDANLDDVHFIGLMCGTALYNSVTVPLKFPPVLYKKLLKKPVTFKDLHYLKPENYQSLKQLLDYEFDDMEDVFCVDFTVPHLNRKNEFVELCHNGSNISVTQKNKEDYVDKVTDYYLNTSIEREFEKFYEGFYNGISENLLSSFNPQELEDILAGEENYDFEAFEQATEYRNGYDRNHRTIYWFWEVFHELELKNKMAFLRFLTGTQRIPAFGIKKLKMEIWPREEQDVHPDTMLPHSITCQNFIMLPRYTNKECLRRNLLCAIEKHTGFSPLAM